MDFEIALSLGLCSTLPQGPTPTSYPKNVHEDIDKVFERFSSVIRYLVKVQYHRNVVYRLTLRVPSRPTAVLVTGGLGYIGSHVCVELLRGKCHIIIIDNLSNSYATVLDSIPKAYQARSGVPRTDCSTRISHIECDYGDSKTVSKAIQVFSQYFQIQGAIHLAASKSVSESFQNPKKYYENNVISSARFLEVLGRHRIANVVFASSATVYGHDQNVEQFLPLTEDMCSLNTISAEASSEASIGKSNLSPYGSTKLICESMLDRWVSSYRRRSCIAFRLFNPVGCDPSGHLGENPKDPICRDGLIPMVLRALNTGMPFEVYGTDYDTTDGSCVRDFVHVGDIARGLVLGYQSCLAASKDHDSKLRVYNLAREVGVSVKDMIDEIESVSGQRVKVEYRARRPGDIAVSIGSFGKARVELGWKPEKGLKDICEDFCRYQEIHGSGN